MNTYARAAVEFTHGEGAHLFDKDGKSYLDALGGIAVCGLGHNHPAVTQAITEQASKLVHCSNLFPITLQEQLATTLCQAAEMDQVFFSNSGAEANEAAIKIARLWGHQNNNDNPQIIVTEGAFHGRTLSTLTASGNRKIQAGFEPLVSGFIRAPYGDIESIKAIGENNSKVVALMLEPIQGEAGVIMPPAGYLKALRELCDTNNWLLIFDEVQTGMGRTGSWFAYQGEGLLPDVVTSAKSLGNGMPIGACMARGKAAKVFQPGNHGSTFGGNPVACAAALAVCQTIKNDHLTESAALRGAQIMQVLSKKLEGVSGVKEIRGQGLMIGIQLAAPCGELVNTALEQG